MDLPNWWWAAEPVAAGPAVVFDLDGVLADAAGRQHYLDPPFPDWEGFFEACGDDPVIDETARILDVLDPSLRVVLVTARPSRVHPQTFSWLRRFDLRWDLLIMRDFGDYESSRMFKYRTVAELRAYGFDLRLAFEDDRRNVDMFRSADVPCVYIHSGYYD